VDAKHSRVVDRAEVEEVLARWATGALSAREVKAFTVGAQAEDQAVREALAELDLLEVFLLTKDDVPALMRLLATSSFERALEEWTKYRDSIDLAARSRALKKDPLYRPFCR
jgi:hypothetical protein